MILRETYQVDSREGRAMTAAPSLGPARVLPEHLSTANPDLLRERLGVPMFGTVGEVRSGAGRATLRPARRP